MVDLHITPPGDPIFDSFKLKPAENRKYEKQSNEKRAGFKRRKVGLFRGLIGQIDKQYENKIYKVSEHRIPLESARKAIRLNLNYTIKK
jgi:hypothetical protein